MYVKQHCIFFIKILKLDPNSCFLHLFCSKVITIQSIINRVWTVIRIGAGDPPFPQGKLFYLRYSVNFMNGLTFFAIKILHITTRTTIAPVVRELRSPRGQSMWVS